MGETTLQASKRVSSQLCQEVGRNSGQIEDLLLTRTLHSAMEMANFLRVSTKSVPVMISVLMVTTNISSFSMLKAKNKTSVVVESVLSKEKEKIIL